MLKPITKFFLSTSTKKTNFLSESSQTALPDLFIVFFDKIVKTQCEFQSKWLADDHNKNWLAFDKKSSAMKCSLGIVKPSCLWL